MIHVFTFNNYHFHTMKTLLSKILSLFILFFVCAQSAQAQGGGNELSAPAEITASSTATLTTFDITSDTTWQLTLSSTVDWVTNFAIIEGDGDTIIVITHKANTDAESREATFTLSARDVLVNPPADIDITFTQQAPIDPLFSILYTQSISASSDATESVYNTGDVLGNWRFSLSSESSWITNMSVAGSPGHPYAINGRYGTDIRITHTANTTSEVREATFTYVDENDFLGNYYTITLRQEAGATAPVTTDVITTQAEVAALSIERFTFDGDLIIKSVQGEDSITDLSPLSNITEVTGDVIIDGGAAADGLTSLKGLRQLQTIGGSFTISNHSALTALDTFPSLQSIGGSFRVFGNSVLTNLGGFSNLANIGSTEEVLIVNTLTGIITIGNADEELPSNSISSKENISLFIMSNPLLEDCCVLTSFFAGATHAVSGEIRIGNNAIGCSDEGRIEISCSLITLTDLDGILSEENFSESKFHYLPQVPEEFRVVNTVYTADVNPTDQTFTVGIDIDNSATGWIVNTTNVFSSSSDSLKEVEDFVTFSDITGMGDGTLDIRIAENTDTAARTAVITFTPTGGENLNARYLVITQEAAFPTLTISSSYPISPKIGSEARYTMNIPPEPITFTINVALGGGAIGWGARRSVDEILGARIGMSSISSNDGPSTVVTGEGDAVTVLGRGDGTVDITTGANTSEHAPERIEIIAFYPITTTGETRGLPVVLEITQLAYNAEPPTIDLSGTGITAPSGSEMNYTTNVNDTAQTISVNIDIGGSTTGWTVSKTSDIERFITLPSDTSGMEDGMVDITIAANTSTERSATIIFTSTGDVGNPVIRTLVITQKAGLSTFMLSSIREYVLTQGVLSPVSNIDTDDNINYTANVGPMLQTLDVAVDIGGNVTGWEVSKSEDADFISLVMRDDRVGITIAPNATIEKRSATLTFASTGDTKTTFTQYLVITQTEGYPTLTLSSTPTPFSVAPDDVVDYTLNVDSSSQDILVNIDLGGSAGGWSIYGIRDGIVGNDDFISFSDTTGTEDETVTFLIESNRSTEVRSALITFLATGNIAESETVTVEGETVTFARTITLAQTVRITQLAEAEPPTLTLSGEGITQPTEENNHIVNVSIEEQMLDVNIDLDGSATGWMVSRTLDIENFITLPATTMGIGDSTVGIAIAENRTTEKRSATITFTSTSTEEDSGNPIIQTLVITQEGITPTLTLTSPNNVRIPNTATTPTDSIEIIFTVGGRATGWTTTLSGNPFLKLKKRRGNAGLDTIKAAVIANTGAERTATITLTTITRYGDPADSRTITIKQEMGTPLTLSIFSNVDFRRGEDSDTVIADATTTTFAVNIDIGGGAMGWEAAETSDLDNFITLPENSGGVDGRLLIMMDPNTDNADRTATITFTTTGDEGDPITRTLVITQKRPLIMLSSNTLTVGFRDTTITVSIDIDERSVTGWEAKEISGLTNFVTLPENSVGNSDGTLDIMVKANNLDIEREARVILIPKIVGGGIDTVTFIDNVMFAYQDDPNPRPRRIELVLYLPTRKMGMDTTIELNTRSVNYDILYDSIKAFLKRRSYTRVENIITPTLVIRQGANPNHTLDISSSDVDLRKSEESDTVIVDAVATATTFTVNIDIDGSATGWEAEISNSVDFIMLSGDSVAVGNGDGRVEIMIEASNINIDRTATITFTTTGDEGNPIARTLVIRQDANPPTLEISSMDGNIRKGEESDTAIVDATEQSLTVNIVLGGSAVNWEATETSDFISLDSDTVSGRGDGTLDITIQENNTNAERRDTITFTATAHSGIIDNEYRLSDTVILIITQLATDFPTLTVLGDTLSARGIGHPVVFEGGTQTFAVAIDTAGSSLENWEISEVDEGDFVTLPDPTTGTGNGEVEFTLSNNESTAFRTATITFTFTGGPSGNSFTQTLEIFQYQKLLTLSGVVIEPLSGDEKYHKRTFPYTAQSFNVFITLDDIISDWQIASNDKDRFVILPESTTGTGNGEVTFRMLKNSSTTDNRADTITFEGRGEGIEIVTRRFLVIEQDVLPMIGIVDPGNRDVTYEAGSVDIEITTGAPSTTWSVNTTAEFVTSLTFTPTGGNAGTSVTPVSGKITLSGTGTGTLKINYSKNITRQTREGTLSVTGSTDEITITQAKLPDHVHVGDVILTNQAAVNDIRNTLGSAVTVIDGYLRVGPSSDITDLSRLDFLTEITGNFFIGGVGASNTALGNIGDFPSLQKIGGGYSVAGNAELIHGGNFPVLESIGDKFIDSGDPSTLQNNIDVLHGYFFIRANSKLKSLGTFPRLKRIGTSFTVRGHDSLRFLYEFPSLISIGTGNPYVPSVDAISDSGFPGNTSIVIEDNDTLTSCCVLRNFFPGEPNAVSGGIYIGNGNAVGCNDTTQITDAMCPPTIILEITNTVVDIGSTATDLSDSIAITFVVGGGATGWKVTLEEDTFIKLGDTTSSVGRVTLKVAVTANTEKEARTDTITLTAIGGTETAETTVTIMQSGILALMLTSESTVDVSNTATGDPSDSIEIIFTVGGGATGWKATTLEDDEDTFITLSDTTGLGGSNTIKVAVDENMGVSRTNTIEITTVGDGDPEKITVLINQEAGPSTLSLTSKDRDTIAHDVDVASDIMFTIGGAAKRWTAAVIDGGNFLTLDPSEGDADATTFRVVTIEKNRGEERTNTIVIMTVGGDPATDTITITQEAVPTIEVTDPSDGMITIAYNDTTPQTITFNVGGSATGWEVSSVDDFITSLSPTMDDNSLTGEVKATLAENGDMSFRTATITISTTGHLGDSVTAEVTVTQKGATSPTLMLTSKNRDTIAHDAVSVSDITFTVGGGAIGWKAKVIDEDKFLTLVDSTGNVGRNTLRVTATGNTGEAIDTIVIETVGGTEVLTDTIIVTQEAVPTIEVTDPSDGMITIANHEVTPQTIRFNVGGSAAGWEVSSVDDFIMSLSPTMDDKSLTGEVKATLMENNGVERTATITISTTGHLGSPLTEKVTITQGAASPTLEVSIPTPKSGSDTTIAYDATTLNVMFTVGGATGWEAKVIDEDKFLTLVDSAGDAGTGTIRVTSNENIGKARIDNIVITTVGGTEVLTDTITVTQVAGPPTLSLSGNSVEIGSTATSDSIAIMFVVGGEATGWMAKVDKDFVTLGDTMGSSGTVTLKAAVTENTGEEQRTATITISTTGHSGDPMTAEFTIVQGGKGTTYTGDITVTTQAQVDALGVSGGALAGNITKIMGNVVIKGSVTDLSIFNNIDTITGYLRAEGLTSLTALSQDTSGNGDYVGLTNLRMVGGYFIVGQGEFEPRSFVGSTNTSLDSVGYFPHLDSIGGFFEIRDNESLDAVGTFPVLRSIGGRFRLRDNPQLLHIPDFDGLVQTGQEITIEVNDKLITVGSFLRLETIGGDLNFTNNPKLTMRGTYPVLRSIGNDFKVDDCDKLQKINDFPLLTTIKGNLQIRNNAVLKSTGNFPVLNSIGGKLEIRNNDLLGDCCGLSGLLSGSIITGTTTIQNNAVGCDSESQINNPLTLISSNESIAYNDTDSITIDFTVGCGVMGWTSTITYTPAADANFITLSSTGSTTQTGAITIMAAPTENMGVERTATITLTPTGSTETADITITQAAGPPTLMLSRTTAIVDATAQTLIVGVTLGGSAEGWEVTETDDDENFITTSKVGDDSLRITILENSSTTDPREATLTFTTTGGTGEVSQTLVITQFKSGVEPPTLTLSLTTADVDSTAQTLTVGVTLGGSAESWGVTETDDKNFITTSRNVGNDSLRITILENTTTDSREATLTFTTEGAASQTLVITQAGGVPTLTITRDDSPELESEGGSEEIEVMSNTTWSVTTMASFVDSLIFTPTGGGIPVTSSSGTLDGTESGTLRIVYAANTEAARSATLIFTTGGTGTVMKTLMITQAAGPPTLMLSRTTAIVDATAQTLIVGVTLGGSAEGWEVTETDDDENFITTSKVGDDSLRITILENSSTTDPREATLTFTTTGGTGEVSQTLVITQFKSGVEPPTLTLSLTTADVDSTAQTLTVGVTLGGSAESWGVTETDDKNFITTSKVGDDSLRITILENTTTDSREATLTFTTEGAASQTLVITQAGGVPTLTITRDDSPELESEGGSEEIEVMSNTTWSVTTMASFVDSLIFTPTGGGIPVTSSSGTLDGTESGTLRIVYAANTEAARSATLIFTTGGTGTVMKTLMITQAAGPPTLMLSRTTAIVDATAQTLIVGVTLGGSAEGWEVTETDDDENFITTSKVGDDSLRITILENSSTTDPREATLTFTTTGGTGEVSQTLVITQFKSGVEPPTLTLSLTTADVDSTAQTLTVGVTLGGSAESWGVTETDDKNFITTSRNVGNDSLRITILENTTTDSREATLTFTTEGAASQTLVITQAGGVPTLTITRDDSPELESEGGSEEIEVMSNTTWSVTTMASFVDSLIFTPTGGGIPVTSSSGTLDGTESGTLRIVYAANTEAARSATLIFTTGGTGTVMKTLMITQAAGPPTLMLSRTTAIVDATAQTLIVGVTLGGSAEGWEVTETDDDENFITTSRNVGNDSLRITILENTTTDSREATLTFTTEGAASQTLVITQAGGVPTLTITRDDSPELESEGGSEEIEVMSNTTWSVTTMASFVDSLIFTPTGGGIPVTSSSGTLDGTESGTLRIVYAANTEAARSATLIFTTGGTGTVMKTLMITQAAGPPTLMLSRTTAIVDATAQTLIVGVTLGGSAEGWEVTETDDKNFITTSRNVGNDSLRITILENTTTDSREATLTFTTEGAASQTLVITQAGGVPTLTITRDDSPELESEGGSEEIEVMSNTTWSVTTMASFVDSLIFTPTGGGIPVTSSSGTLDGTESGTLRIVYAANTEAARSATLIFTTGGTGTVMKTLMITQAAGPPTLMLSRTTAIVDATAQTLIVGVTLGGSAEGWEVTETDDDENFITTSRNVGNDSLRITILENTTTDSREATLTFTTEGAASQTLVITQAGGVPTLTITRDDSPELESEGGSEEIEVMSNTTWSVTTMASFVDSLIFTPTGGGIPVTSSSGTLDGTESGTLRIVYAANTEAARSATLIFTTGGTGTVMKTLMITQAAGPPTLMLSRTTAIVDATAQTLIVGVTLGGSAEGWEVTETDDDENFITTSKVGDDSLRITILENSSTTDPREATLTFTTTGGTGEVSQTLVITQFKSGVEPPTLTLSLTTADVDSTAQTLTVGVTLGGSAESWGVTETDDKNFITTSKVGDDSLRITILENTTTDSREATLTFTTEGAASQTLVITQAGGVPTLTITRDDSPELESEGGSEEIEVMSNTTWSVTTMASFVDSLIFTPTGGGIPVTSSSGTLDGTESGTLRIVYAANTEAARSATLIFTTGGTGTVMKTLMITQAAGLPTIMLTSGNTVDVPNTATSSDSIEITFVVGGGSTGWIAEVDEDFVTLGKTMGSSGTATLKAAVKENTGVERTAIIILTATTEGTEKADTTIMIKQGGAPPTLEVSIPTPKSGSDTTIAYDATTLNVMFTVGGGATGWEATVIDGDANTNDFVTLSKSFGTAGTGTINVSFDENTGGERMDTVVITTVGGTGDAADTVIVTQEAVPTIKVTDSSDGMITINHDVTDAQTIMFDVGGSATGWTASSDQDFIRLDTMMGSSGTGIKVMATPMANMDVERSATITLMTTGQLGTAKMTTVTFTQKGPLNAPKLDVTTPSGLTDTVANTATTSSDSIEIMFTVEKAMGWESMISYGAGVVDFVTLSETANVDQIGDVTIKAAVTKNEGVERSATITLSTTGQTSPFSAATRDITIVQRGAPPTITESGDTTIAYNVTATDTLDVITFEVGGGATGWEAKVIDGDKFLTLVDSKGDADTGTIRVTATGNTGEARMDTIVITTEGGTGDADADTVIVTQEAIPTIEITDPMDKMITIDYNAVTDTTITFNVGGSATGWTAASSDQGFVRLDTMGSSGEGIEVTATPMANTGAERTATVTITTTGQLGASITEEVTIMQSAAPPHTLMLTSDNTVDVANTATVSTDSVEIRFVVGGEATGWKAAVDEDFVTLDTTMGSSGTDTLTLKAAVTANTGAERTAIITLTTTGNIGTAVDTTIMIKQAAGAPTLLLISDSSVTVANTATASADSIEIMFVVGGEATGWKAAVDEDFVTLDTTMGSLGTDTLTLKAAVTANPGAERTATVTITTTGQLGDSVTAEVTITQATGIVPPVSNPPTLMLTSKNAVSVTNAATVPADSIEIMFTVGGGATGWTAAVNPTFVTLGKSTGSTGTVTLKAAVTANAGVPARTATITLTTIGGTGTAVDTTITITQAGTTPLSVPTQTPLAIYPNPVGNTLTIEGASTSLQISIMDFSGRQVVYSELSTGQNTLDVADLPSGLYVIIVHGEEGEVFTGQIFKK